LLLKQGVKDLEHFETLLVAKKAKSIELSKLVDIESQIVDLKKNKDVIKASISSLRNDICTSRRDFLESILTGTNVRMKVSPFRDQDYCLRRLREILQRETGFEDDLEKIVTKIYGSKKDIPTALLEVQEELVSIKNGGQVSSLGKHFHNLVNG